MREMDLDEDAAPALVDVDEIKKSIQDERDTTASEFQDLSLVKVPITIVTGKFRHHYI